MPCLVEFVCNFCSTDSFYYRLLERLVIAAGKCLAGVPWHMGRIDQLELAVYLDEEAFHDEPNHLDLELLDMAPEHWDFGFLREGDDTMQRELELMQLELTA